MKEDIGERNDLAKSNPKKLKELQTAFADWSKRMMPAKWIRQDARNAEVGGKLKANPTKKRKRGAVNRAFKKQDTHGDGKITRDEATNKAAFDAADANKDGSVTLTELRTFLRKRGTQLNKLSGVQRCRPHG